MKENYLCSISKKVFVNITCPLGFKLSAFAECFFLKRGAELQCYWSRDDTFIGCWHTYWQLIIVKN